MNKFAVFEAFAFNPEFKANKGTILTVTGRGMYSRRVAWSHSWLCCGLDGEPKSSGTWLSWIALSGIELGRYKRRTVHLRIGVFRKRKH